MTATTDEARGRWRAAASPRNIGAVYVWIGIIVAFAIWEPHTFLTEGTAKTILNNFAITGIVALSLVIPLAAGLFDVSVGYVVGLAGIVAAHSVAEYGLSGWAAIAVALVVSALLGAVNAVVVVVLDVNSLIGTLATGSLFAAATIAISDEKSITRNVVLLSDILASKHVLGVTIPVVVMVVAMILIALLLEQTVIGRYWYAIGFDPEVARLVGLRVKLLQSIALMAGSTLAGLAGVLLTARVGSGVPSSGPSYLLPAFAAVFLGATQFRHGRFNPYGTVVAVLLIGTGTMGLSLVGAPRWSSQVFQGVVLIAAVALTGTVRRT